MSTYTQVSGQQPDLRKMVKGQPVMELQLLLDKHCYGPVPDGYFGDENERCLNEFKAAYGMMADGRVDRATWSVLNSPTTASTPRRSPSVRTPTPSSTRSYIGQVV